MTISRNRHRSLLILCSVISLTTGGAVGFLTARPQGRSLTVVTPDPTATPEPTATMAPLRVYVSGAVVTAAVYRLAPGSLVEDAVRMAGGPVSEADMDCINLAQALLDQQQVYVPYKGEADPPPVLSGGVSMVVESLVNINTAGVNELETLPKVGPATAQSIVEYRELYGLFSAIEEIMEVPGIGPSTFYEIENRITVGE